MTAERERLRRRYERLLWVYPRDYRDRHGQELVDTLLDGSADGQSVPRLREALALALEGTRLRAVRATSTPVTWWRDGLHLGVTVLLLSMLLVRAAFDPPAFSPWWWLLAALTVLVWRGWIRVAAPVAVLAAISASGPLLHSPLLWSTMNTWPVTPPAFGDWYAIAPYVVAAAGLLVLAAAQPFRSRTGRAALRARSPAWWLIPSGLAVATASGAASWPVQPSWRLLIATIEVTGLAAAATASALTGDPRWSLAAVVYLAPTLIHLATEGINTPYAAAYTATSWALPTAGTALVIAQRHRRPHVR